MTIIEMSNRPHLVLVPWCLELKHPPICCCNGEPSSTVTLNITVSDKYAPNVWSNTRLPDFSPVNCPLMAASYNSPNFAGMLRVDANTGQKPQYTPNSFPDYPKLRGDKETPMKLISNIMSREAPTFIHDTKDSEYDQVSPDDQI